MMIFIELYLNASTLETTVSVYLPLDAWTSLCQNVESTSSSKESLTFFSSVKLYFETHAQLIISILLRVVKGLLSIMRTDMRQANDGAERQ